MNFKLLIALLVVAMAPAWAQAHYDTPLTVAGMGMAAIDPVTGIVLQGGPGQGITFSGQGAGSSGVGVTFGSCTAGVCTLTGSASGSGGLLSSAAFSLTSMPGAFVLTPTSQAGVFNASGSAQLALTGTAGGVTGTLLTGTLNLVNFSQAELGAGGASVIGTFNQSASGSIANNLTITGGLLASLFTSAGGQIQLNVELPSPAAIALLEGTNASVTAGMISTSLTPTPEPPAWMLMGLGLAAMLLLRRRRTPAGRPTLVQLAQLG